MPSAGGKHLSICSDDFAIINRMTGVSWPSAAEYVLRRLYTDGLFGLKVASKAMMRDGGAKGTRIVSSAVERRPKLRSIFENDNS